MGNTISTKQKEEAQSDVKTSESVLGCCKDLNKCLDLIGYSYEMVLFRRETNKLMDEIHNMQPFSVSNITTGGKAEGTAIYFESDIDRLYAVKGVGCVESEMECSRPSVFHLDRGGCSPGYTRLVVVRMSDTDGVLRRHLIREKDEFYVANSYTIFEENEHMIDINGERITKQAKSGPSAPYGNTSIKYDFVFGFECLCPELIKKWVERRRHCNWPDPNLIEEIATLEGHVVPVANKGSRSPKSEWRMCYTKAELLLMHSFNEIQTKLYILLKLVAKSVLKPLCSEMSSYIMKNIMFWMVENNPKEKFSESVLIDRLTDALRFLRECLFSGTLNSYMIEDRNLFEGRIPADERDKLLGALDEHLCEPHLMLQCCEKLRHAMRQLNESPIEFAKQSEKRDKIEKLVYQKNLIFKRTDQPGQTVEEIQERLRENNMYMKYDDELKKLLVPDKIDIEKKGGHPDDVFKQRLAQVLA